MTFAQMIRYSSLMSPRPVSTLKSEPGSPAAARRLAMLMDLPLRDAPETDEERAIFDDAQAALSQGLRGHSTADVLAAIESARTAATAR